MTAAIALYQALRLPLPTSVPARRGGDGDGEGEEEGTAGGVLIYGGSTAVGAYALQLAKLSNLSPIVAVAGKGIEYVRSLDAATHIIGYRDGDVAQRVIETVKAHAPGQQQQQQPPFRHALDAVSDFGSHKVISDILVGLCDSSGSGGGNEGEGHVGQRKKNKMMLINMLDLSAEMDDSWQWPDGVAWSLTFVASAYGRKHPWMSEERARADRDFACWFYRYVERLLADGRLRPHPVEVLPGGLDGVLQGVKDLRDNKVSAKKLDRR
ncbi:hypothetical protein JDV02_010782 [Purpureocillium takamizusanense]|uniref:Alcohol dehydrogenase-like C-terminal domain-containing protein n=1 Tax=Purpureocillium takamizusanense TaxID=2060973 RepID=A0A9Q8QTD6_9HYPO|nr:uncharacterized protein JDV02_010782 [Purpureocillium takamizusanense]UNI25077.1 hypothetical protein JDV02_010782 [Purpureocillium takamizusanense]